VGKFLAETLSLNDPEKSRGRELSARELLDLSAQQIDTRFANDAVTQAQLHHTVGEIYVALYTVRAYNTGGPDKNRVFTQLDVVEPKPMQAGQVQVDANAMAREIAAHGKVALYGIHFDSNKTEIKPESKPALDEIGKLLKQNAALKLLVVGHTDNAGEFDYNLDLSRRRAQSVVQALTGGYGVAPARLRAAGVSYAAPVASNRAEDGRAKNRRVELVEQ